MARRRTSRQEKYYSSKEKNFVREKYDLPLIEAAARRKRRQIRYFGLPGEEALDLRCWGSLCEYVAAVEFCGKRFQNVKHVLRTQFGSIGHRVLLGDVDKIILRNKSGSSPPDFVSTTFRQDSGYIWDFDVVYLDYFGRFLPYDRGGPVVRNRANALRRLFAPDRQDAWQPWLLILTVESTLFGSTDREQMRQFLTTSREGMDGETRDAIDFLLQETSCRTEEATRLVHGTLSHLIAIAASNSDVRVVPKSTVLYSGANKTPMLHFAYEVIPSNVLSGAHPALPLLRSPLLQVRNGYAEPGFELLPAQPPGQTDSSLREALNFLDEEQIEQIL